MMAQHTFMENVHRNTEDWFAVKAAVRGKGVDCPDSTPTADVAGKIEEIETYKSDLIDLIERDITDITIPAGTTKIGAYAFYHCSNLESVVIPESVTTIEDRAFAYTRLTEIEIPDNVADVGVYAFSSNMSIQSATLSKNLLIISSGLFLECVNLSTIRIPSGVTEIKSYAFYNNLRLTKIYIPKSVTKIESTAFHVNISGAYQKFVYYEGTAEEWDLVQKDDAFPSGTFYIMKSYTPT